VLAQLARHKVVLSGVATGAAEVAAAPEVDIKRVLEAQAKGVKGGVGGMPFEEARAAILKEPGDAALGAKLFQRQGCVSCHTVSPNDAPRGPMLRDISKRYEKPVLIESILKPNAVIAQGFESFIFGMSNGDRVVGFVTDEGAEDLTIRTAGGERQTLVKSRIEARRKADLSMMPEGLVAALSPKEVASLLAFLETLTSK
jgi:putative heme-binding domain-containing protein